MERLYFTLINVKVTSEVKFPMFVMFVLNGAEDQQKEERPNPMSFHVADTCKLIIWQNLGHHKITDIPFFPDPQSQLSFGF